MSLMATLPAITGGMPSLTQSLRVFTIPTVFVAIYVVASNVGVIVNYLEQVAWKAWEEQQRTLAEQAAAAALARQKLVKAPQAAAPAAAAPPPAAAPAPDRPAPQAFPQEVVTPRARSRQPSRQPSRSPRAPPMATPPAVASPHPRTGCALADDTFALRYCSFTSADAPFAPFWPSAQACLDFVVNVLPEVLQFNMTGSSIEAMLLLLRTQGVNAMALPPLDRDLICACLRNDVHKIKTLIDKGASVRTASGSSPLIVASRWGNWRTVRELLAHGAVASDRDQWDRLAISYAAEGGFVPTVEALLGRSANTITCADIRDMELSESHAARFQKAVDCYVRMLDEVHEAEVCLLPTGTKPRAVLGERALSSDAYDKHDSNGPTSLIHPTGAEAAFLESTIDAPSDGVYKYFIAHAFYPASFEANDEDAKQAYFESKAACVARAVPLLEPEHNDRFEDLPIFLSPNCIPQWDIDVKFKHIRVAFQGATLRSERMLLVLNPAAFERCVIRLDPPPSRPSSAPVLPADCPYARPNVAATG